MTDASSGASRAAAQRAGRVPRDEFDISYRGVLDSMTDGVMTVSSNGRIGILNAAGAAILGREREVMAASRLADFAAGHDGAAAFVEAIGAAMKEGGSGRRRIIDYTRGADARRLAIAIAPHQLLTGTETGQDGIVAVFSDVTEFERLNRAEVDLRQSLQEEHTKLQSAYVDLEKSTHRLQQATRRIQLVRLMATVGVLLLFGLAAAYIWYEFGGSGVRERASPASVGAVAQTIVAQAQPISLTTAAVGSIEAGSIINLVSPFDGQVKEKRFTYGNAVAHSETLVVMDTGELKNRLRDAQTALIKARQQLQQMQNWSSGIEMSRAKRAVNTAQLDVDNLKAKMRETKTLLDKGIVARSEFTDLQQQLQARQMQLDDAQQDMDSVADRGSADNQKIAGFEFANAEQRVKELDDDLAKATVVSPVAGVVLKPLEDSEAGGRTQSVEVGSHVIRGQTLVSVGNLETFTVKATIDEVDINKIRVGEAVSVTGDAFGDLTLVGKVTSVAAQAGADPNGRAGMPVFPITVAVETPDADARRLVHVGMSATLTIITYENPNAIVLPPAAVTGEGDHAAVTVQAANSSDTHTMPVKLGVSTPAGIEIREGLKPGDTVVIGH